MNYCVRSYRRSNGISLDLDVGYRNVWADRMPNVLQMIGQGLSLKAIGRHYGCHPTNVSAAMKRQGHIINYVKAEFKRLAQIK